jgi:hypothetical protein
MPKLENWSVVNNRAYGEIYADSRFPDGKAIVTSQISHIIGGYLKTRNTLYELGKSAEAPALKLVEA